MEVFITLNRRQVELKEKTFLDSTDPLLQGPKTISALAANIPALNS
jgi:hypothetical protein